MEKLVEEGIAKNIGLSNFNSTQIQRIWDEAKVKPSNLQVLLSRQAIGYTCHKSHKL